MYPFLNDQFIRPIFLNEKQRLRLSTFAQLMLQVDSVNKMEDSQEPLEDEDEIIAPKPVETNRSITCLDVINGTGELNLKEQNRLDALPEQPPVPIVETPYAQMWVAVHNIFVEN